MSNGPWTDEENELIVADCFAMLADDISTRHYSKAAHRRAAAMAARCGGVTACQRSDEKISWGH